MTKVKVSREVAEAIERLRESGSSDWRLIGIATEPDNYHTYKLDDFATVLNEYATLENQDNLLSAIINGYEVEKTPEESVREYYKGINELVADLQKPTNHGERRGIRKTLDLLGIKIEGVNA